MDQKVLQEALAVFELTDEVTVELLNERYQALLFKWHPHRYANLTNNPQKYMEMYKKGETKTKELHATYNVLVKMVGRAKE